MADQQPRTALAPGRAEGALNPNPPSAQALPRPLGPPSGSEGLAPGPGGETTRAWRQDSPTVLGPHVLLSLVGFTLLLSGFVATLPEVVRDLRPRNRVLAPLEPLQEVWIVQAPGDRWYLAGHPIDRNALARRLHQGGDHARLHFLPSAALPLGEVSASLRWLRRQGTAPVQLELPPRP